ncbi:hypothetical protein PV729_39880 [Streptomyces europaeiscabiei]|uniref:MmyB-like transcription regulator ligand binding domain-containing protein n=1 Tax=Streptomyces europaeiscabiei TaxID=146819 RepID=A0ABU4NSL8_9ACTN|nr:hypothetical protein [Streptomyces europaeiscabiei]MDX3547378.1 hypothetical protein [Streptomyces europaeiscabiei]MDX3557814.1 hypothetical protein [Streptomyces europaeiscabiei]MDX3705729.1 hypothetical protein [Streptomyces europaeiscabiei]
MPAPLFASDTTARRGHADFARFHFLDPVAADFSVDWEAGARVTVALLRAEAGRHPADPDLRELVGEHFPAEQWIHLRTTNPIESTFSTVKHRTKVTRGAGSPASALAMVFKLVESAQARWRAVTGAHLVALVRAGARFENGHLVERPEAAAA